MFRPESRIAAAWLLIVLTASLASGQGTLPPGLSRTGPIPSSFQTPDVRITRLTSWLKAIADHQPGRIDAALEQAASWKFAQLQGIAIDTANLALLMRNPRIAAFSLETDRRRTQIIYTPVQWRRLRAIACAAGGYLSPALTADRRAGIEAECAQSLGDLPEELIEASAYFAAERLRRNGDDNLALFRAAVLHADVAMLLPPVINVDEATSLPIGPRSVRLQIVDGRVTSINLAALHWHIADELVERVRPLAEDDPAPQKDARVLAWYQTTTRWLHSQEQYDDRHIDRARRLFPTDAQLLFLIGCQHEAYASPSLAPGLRLAGMTTRNQLQIAEQSFADALTRDPALGLAALRRGRVLNLLGRYADSAAALHRAESNLPDDDALRYFWNLFLGEAEEGQEHYDAARQAYQRARSLFPRAQKPLLAISQLEWRRDAKSAGATSIAEMFARSSDPDVTSDPWQRYFVSHTADAERDIADLWQTLTGATK